MSRSIALVALIVLIAFGQSLSAFSDFGDRQSSLSKKSKTRAAQVRAFVLDSQYPLSERQKAATFLAKQSKGETLIKALLLAAELESRGQSRRRFFRALRRAKTEAQKQKSKKWLNIFRDLASVEKSFKRPGNKTSWRKNIRNDHARFFQKARLTYSKLHLEALYLKHLLRTSKADSPERKLALRKVKSAQSRLKKRVYKSRDFHSLRALYPQILTPYTESPEDALFTYFYADRFRVDLRSSAKDDTYFYRWSSRTFSRCQKSKIDCIAFEKSRFKTQSYFDFSSLKARSSFDESLGQMATKMFSPLLSACLQKNKGLTRETHLELNWSVGHNGKVTRSEIWRPTRLRKSPVDACFLEALSHFRYAPYRGEIKTVGMAFDVD